MAKSKIHAVIDLDLKIEDREKVFWKEVKNQAEDELEKVERNYWRSKLFQEEIIKLAKDKIGKEDSNKPNK